MDEIPTVIFDDINTTNSFIALLSEDCKVVMKIKIQQPCLRTEIFDWYIQEQLI